jgi:putative endonuclease
VTPRALLDRLLEVFRLDRPPAYRGQRGVGQRWEALAARTPAYRGQRGVGQRWEALAARRLRREGYTLKERNFRARAGEIDLIAEENGVLCFVEVKGRRGEGFGAPAEAVTLEKQRRIARAAQEYLAVRRLGAPPCRFDVVAILESDGATQITILRDAFEQPPQR